MSTLVKIKFKNRSDKNKSDHAVARKRGKLDVDLISSDTKKVSTNKFVMSMFSKVLADDLADMHVDGLWIISLDFPHEIVKIIVDLLYNSEVTVPKNLELKVKKALNDLKITGTETVDLNIENFKKPMKAPTSQPKNVVGPKRKPVMQSDKNQMSSNAPGKSSQRAQSTLVQGSPRDDSQITNKVTPIVSGNQSSSIKMSGVNPQLNATKVIRSVNGAAQSPNPAKPQNATVKAPEKLISNGQSQPQMRPAQRMTQTIEQEIFPNGNGIQKKSSNDDKIAGLGDGIKTMGINQPPYLKIKKMISPVNAAAQNQSPNPTPVKPQNVTVQTPENLVSVDQTQQQMRTVQRTAPAKERGASTSISIDEKVADANESMKIQDINLASNSNIKKVVRSVNGSAQVQSPNRSPPAQPQNALVKTPEKMDFELHSNGQVQQQVEQPDSVQQVTQAEEPELSPEDEILKNSSGEEKVVEPDRDLTPVPMEIDDSIGLDQYTNEDGDENGEQDDIDGL